MSAVLRHHNAPAEGADWLRREAIAEYADLIESLSISLREAAGRGSDALAAMHLRQIVHVTRAATQTMTEIGGAK
jgi:hypothetical protein